MKNAPKWIFSFVLALILVAISSQVLADGDKKARSYAGGADEEDLKVQNELPVPPVKIDRKSMEQKALQGFLKKSGTAGTPAKPEEQR